MDFLPANVSKPRQRFFDSVVPFNLLLVECKTTGFGQMLLFFFNIRHEIFWSKNDPLCRRQKLLSPRRVDFLLTHLSKPRHCSFYSVVRSNLLLIECKITRFGLLHPTKNPNRSSQLFPPFSARILMFARRHSFASTATTHGPISK